MKGTCFIYVIVCFISCNSKEIKLVDPSFDKTLTEQQKRSYFNDSFALRYGFGYSDINDSTHSFEVFFKKYYPNIKTLYPYDAFPYAFEEQYIDTTEIEPEKQWFRVIMNKPFRLPIAFIIEKKGEKTLLTAKATNGDGGYYTGTLAVTYNVSLNTILSSELFNTLDSIDFWQLGIDTTCELYIHPESWVIEAINKGKYNFIHRTQPNGCKDEKTLLLYKVVSKIRNESKLEKILNLLNDKNGG